MVLLLCFLLGILLAHCLSLFLMLAVVIWLFRIGQQWLFRICFELFLLSRIVNLYKVEQKICTKVQVTSASANTLEQISEQEVIKSLKGHNFHNLVERTKSSVFYIEYVAMKYFLS